MADGVTRSPSRRCSRDGKICFYGDALSTIFLLLCLASYFSFSFLSFLLLSSQYVYSLGAPSSVEQPPATLSEYFESMYVIVRILSACVICIPPDLEFFLFFVRLVFFRGSYFSGGVFFVVVLFRGTRYACT